MKNSKKRNKLVAGLLSATVAVSIVGGMFAAPATSKFSDVPSNHWATSYINKMSEGGLIKGYGNGKYGPEDKLTIGQLAKLICSAKGYAGKSANNTKYWAYGVVDYCINDLQCLPNLGAITPQNYDKNCSRELAFYMLEKGLGAGPDAELTQQPLLTAADIPDFANITYTYADIILRAYQEGVCIGNDAKGTFNPKAALSRAQAATMFVRAGWIKAADVAETGEGKTNAEIFNEIKALGLWTEGKDPLYGGRMLTAKDPKYGGITVTEAGSVLFIDMAEWNKAAWGNNANGWKALDGSLVQSQYDSNGKMIVSSGFSYDARMLVKQALQIAYPNHPDEAINAFKSAFMQEIWEASEYPSALRWIDSRGLQCSYGEHAFSLVILELNDEALYNEAHANLHIGAKYKFSSYNGSIANDIKAWELTKW